MRRRGYILVKKGKLNSFWYYLLVAVVRTTNIYFTRKRVFTEKFAQINWLRDFCRFDGMTTVVHKCYLCGINYI